MRLRTSLHRPLLSIASPRLSPWTKASAALLATFALVAAAPMARADDDKGGDAAFEVKVAKGEVTVTAHGEWHINKEFPWKLVVGDVKLDRSRFELGETTAHVRGAPSGTAKLRGAICSKDVCRTLERDLDVP
jgi:hypothetical protein